jgi:hypothetical protein
LYREIASGSEWVFPSRGDLHQPIAKSTLKEALNNSIQELSEHEKQKCDFCFSSFFDYLRNRKMAARPCAAGNSE